jgi:DNA-nicking Smr family endonuclease
MSRRRHLSEEERALWWGFARSITPLRDAPEPSPASSAAEESASGKIAAAVPAAAAPAQHPDTGAQKKSPPLAPLGRRLRRRVARGREPIDGRIDLHGLTQARAHAALLRFLRGAQTDGARVVLVVTGKGTGGADRDAAAAERGVLKRQVPLWLSLPEFRPFVLGFEDAHAGHGGQGALYVRLRRGR